MPPTQTKDKFGNYVTDIGGGFKTTTASTPISANDLRPSIPLNLPQTSPDTTDYNGMIASGNAMLSAPTLTAPEVTPAPAPKEQSPIEKFLSGLKAPASTAEAYQTAYDTVGLSTAEQDVLAKQKIVRTAQGKLATINAQLGALNAGATSESLQQENRLAPQFAITGEQANIARQRAIQALPLQAQALAAQAEVQSAQGDVELAQNTMKMASDRLTTLFNLQSKDIENEYNYNKEIRTAVYQDATEKEKAQLDRMNKEDDRNHQIVMQNLKDKADLANTALEAGQASLAARITQLDPKSNTYTQDLAMLQREIRMPQKTTNTGLTPTQFIAGLTPEQQKDPFIAKLAASAGGKPITDTFAQQLNKGLAVLGQLGVLQTNIKDVSTGPIVGAFRGANPWDTNAQTIKAQLNAIVPNLARGVYGEVGVLTDNDIAQYSKTLPNLKSPEDIRNAVLGITVDLIGKSVKRTLEINAANQKDVSGFIDLYTEMQSTRDAIFNQIPGYKGAGTQSLQSIGVSKEDESVFDKTIGTAGGEKKGGFWSDLWKGLGIK